MSIKDLTDRFWGQVEKTDSCWIWTGPKASKGYGLFCAEGRRHIASRWVEVQAHGPLPPGIDVCHHCDNPPCVRPEHLFRGTRSDNMRDCAKKGRLNLQTDPPKKALTHCPSGHPYSVNNTYRNRHGHRRCKVCTDASNTRSIHRRREAQ